MGLDLNNTIVPYKEFYGRNVDQMPALIAESRIPLSVAGLMQQRLRSGKQDWKDNYFDTGDAIVYHPDGRVKIVLDSQLLRDINPKSELLNGALVLVDGVYETLQGPEFTREKLAKITERDLALEEVKTHPFWQTLARDGALLNEYADSMGAEMKQRFKYDSIMGVYLASAEKKPTARAACVYGLVDGNGSDAGDGYGLDFGFGRLVGVAPEALSAPARQS